jgi:hypothetical protein
MMPFKTGLVLTLFFSAQTHQKKSDIPSVAIRFIEGAIGALEGSGEVSLSQHEARSNKHSVQSEAVHTEANTTKKPNKQPSKSLVAKKGK